MRVLCERAKGEAKQRSGAFEEMARRACEWCLEEQEGVSQEGTFNAWKLHLPAYLDTKE